jgi:hypothetical protein
VEGMSERTTRAAAWAIFSICICVPWSRSTRRCLETASNELTAAVGAAVNPRSVQLWLRRPGGEP